MRKFWKIDDDYEKEKEDDIHYTREYDEKQEELQRIKGELDCEETITEEKQLYGRVRTTTMKYLRVKHSTDVADRAMRRVNKRIKNKSFTKQLF